MASEYSFCRAAARGPGVCWTGGAAAGDGEREGADMADDVDAKMRGCEDEGRAVKGFSVPVDERLPARDARVLIGLISLVLVSRVDLMHKTCQQSRMPGLAQVVSVLCIAHLGTAYR